MATSNVGQDHDGSHIKGLIINFLDHFYPSLLRIPDFLVEFITPIVKVWRGKQEFSFYTMPQYEDWKSANNEGKGWESKYYKVTTRLPVFERCAETTRVLVRVPPAMPSDTLAISENTAWPLIQ